MRLGTYSDLVASPARFFDRGFSTISSALSARSLASIRISRIGNVAKNAVARAFRDGAVIERPIQAARGSIIDVLDERLLAEPGITKPCGEFLVVAAGHLPVEQEGQPFQIGERRRLGGDLSSAEGLGHAEQPELVELVEWDG